MRVRDSEHFFCCQGNTAKQLSHNSPVLKESTLNLLEEEMSVGSDYCSSGAGKLPQIDKGMHCGGSYNPLSELMRAIILRVVDDLRSGGELRAEAVAYLNDEDEEYIFSFISICRHFDLDPAKTKHHILQPKHKIRTRRRAS